MSENTIIAILLAIVAWSMAEQGAQFGIFYFVGFFLVPYGFGRFLWSPDRLKDRYGWLSILLGLATLWHADSFLLIGYAVTAVLAQLVAWALAIFFYGSPKTDKRKDNEIN